MDTEDRVNRAIISGRLVEELLKLTPTEMGHHRFVCDAVHRGLVIAAGLIGVEPPEPFRIVYDGSISINWQQGPYRWSYWASFLIADTVNMFCEPDTSTAICIENYKVR